MPARALASLVVLLLALPVAGCGAKHRGGASTTSTTATAAHDNRDLNTKPVVKVPSGPPPGRLTIRDIVRGTGPVAHRGDTVTAQYVGVDYADGRQFDSSWDSGTLFTSALSPGSVIDGWVRGIPGMRVGGRRELVIPPRLAYGAAGGPGIAPNSTLIFIIDLLRVQPG